MTNALAIYKDFDGLQRAAMALQASGYFQDVKSEAQAIVKVMAGSELGLPPFASMAGIHIIQGKPVLGANVMATLVKNDPRYDYRIITDTVDQDKEMYLQFYEDGKPVGVAGFTIKEAQVAGLTGKDNWKKYTSDMLFARAISRGARRYAPGIFGGSPVYTPDEMGVDTDEEGYVISRPIEAVDILDAEPDMLQAELDQLEREVLSMAKPQPAKKAPGKFARPMTPETLREALAQKAIGFGVYEATDKQRNFLGSLLNEFFQDDTKRHEASEWLLGAASTKEVDGALVKAALDWLKPEKDDGGAYVIDRDAQAELSSVATVALQSAGQMAL